MEFEVGDRVKIIGGNQDGYWTRRGYKIGEICRVVNTPPHGVELRKRNTADDFVPFATLKEIKLIERGKPMSKYQSLKERIDNVTAWYRNN